MRLIEERIELPEIEDAQFKDMVETHSPVSSEDLREVLRKAVQVHILEEDADEAPTIGVTPCFLIAVCYELICRRYQAGDLRIPPQTVQ